MTANAASSNGGRLYRLMFWGDYERHSFSWGRGSAVGMEQVITESVKKHLEIIQAVDRLELQWGDRELFSALSARIIAMNGETRQG